MFSRYRAVTSVEKTLKFCQPPVPETVAVAMTGPPRLSSLTSTVPPAVALGVDMELRRAFGAKIDIVVHGIRVIRTKHPGQVSFPAAGFSAEAYPVRIVFSFQLVGSIPCFPFMVVKVNHSRLRG